MESILDFGAVQLIRGDKGGRYPFCNSIYLPTAGVLIDPASNRSILKDLRSNITSVWLSHWHEDHIMHLDLFRDKPIHMHELDEPPLTDIDTFIDWYGLETATDQPLRDYWKTQLSELFHYQPRKATYHFQDDEIIDFGNLTVKVIHAPGHSPGNLSFLFVEPEILFIGDNDLTRFGPWYGDRYSDIDQIIGTIGKLRQIPAKILLTGHESGLFENVTTNIWDNYLSVIDQREEKLYQFLAEPRSLEEIGKAWIVYGKPIKPIAEFLKIEKLSMIKHAERLIARGQVKFEDGLYHRIS